MPQGALKGPWDLATVAILPSCIAQLMITGEDVAIDRLRWSSCTAELQKEGKKRKRKRKEDRRELHVTLLVLAR